MVVKTDLCSFSENRIYPGHGIRFIRRDGQTLIFANSKSKSLYNQRKKPAKLQWTQAWRRLNKKARDENVQKKKSRRIIRVQRAIVGASLADLKKKTQAPKVKNAATEAALKEVKANAKAKAVAKNQNATPTSAGAPRTQKPIAHR